MGKIVEMEGIKSDLDIFICDLPLDYNRSKDSKYDYREVNQIISSSIKIKCLDIATQMDVDPKVIYIAAYCVWLSKYLDSRESMINANFDNENISISLDNMKDMTFRSVVSNIQDQLENGQFKKKSNLSVSVCESLLESLFENMEEDLNVSFLLKGDTLNIRYLFNGYLFEEATIDRMSNHLVKILTNVIQTPDELLKNLSLLTESEKINTLEQWNCTDDNAVITENVSVYDLFYKQVKDTPNETAIIFKGKRFTYKDIKEKANSLSYELIKSGVRRGETVGIYLERTTDIFSTILSILKIGCTYVPIDPEYPIDRVDYIISSGEINTVITESKFDFDLRDKVMNTIFADKCDSSSKEEIQPVKYDRDSVAYILYTSGSTGKPKGVEIKQESLINLNGALKERLCISKYSSILCLTTYTFDIFFTESLFALINGLTIVLATEVEQKDAGELSKLLNDNEIDIMQATPSRMKFLLDHIEDVSALERIKAVIFTGEKLPLNLVNKMFSYENIKIYNFYGPTETTVYSLIYEVKKEDNKVLIGKPLKNTKIYILDSNLQPLPVGVPGELFISGAGLAKGYKGKEDLTNKSFISNPFESGKLFYRTGDLAKWNQDGTVEYIDRIDNQVKIRGYRVELEEIEKNIYDTGEFESVVVTAKEDQYENKYLIAYLVVRENAKITSADLRTKISSKIPDYMVPSYFIKINEIPYTSNGKIDRKNLPYPSENNIWKDNEYEAPRTKTEKLVAKIFEKVFGRKNIGINDDFLELGGYSLLAVKIVTRMVKKFRLNFTTLDLFNNPTVKELAELTDSKLSDESKIEISSIESISRDREVYKLSDSQRGMWITEKITSRDNLYNVSNILKIEEEIDFDILEETVNNITQKHEVFRYRFEEIDGEPQVCLKRKKKFKLQLKDLSEYEHNEALEILNKEIRKDSKCKFDLNKGNLFKFKLYKINSKKYYLSLIIHHIIFDGVSLNVLASEINSTYNLIKNNEIEKQVQLPVQYIDYVEWSNKSAKESEIQVKRDYWKNKLDDIPPLASFPTDFKYPTSRNYEGATFQASFSKEETGLIKNYCKECGTTLFSALLSAFKVLMYRYTNETDIPVGIPLSGRTVEDTENLIGLFVNTAVIRSQFDDFDNFNNIVNLVKTSILEADKNQGVSLEQIIDDLGIKRSPGYTPLYQVMFAMQSQEEFQTKGIVKEIDEIGNGVSSQYDITLSITDKDAYLDVLVEYSTELYTKETIEQIMEHYIRLTSLLVKVPEDSIATVQFVDNNSDEVAMTLEIDEFEPIINMFEKAVLESPDKIALISNGNTLTYSELNNRVNILANDIKKKCPSTKENIVGVLLDRSIEYVISILAILKSGGAYLPLDPTYPKERLDYILKDSDCSLVVSSTDILTDTKTEKEVINIDGVDFTQMDVSNPNYELSDSQLAYVIYTSGTTGKPKGVMVEHGNIFNTISWRKEKYEMDKEDSVLHLLSFAFDASITTLFTSLVSGGSVVIQENEQIKDPEKIVGAIKNHIITHFSCTPILFKYILANATPGELESVKIVTLGGEAISQELVDLVNEQYSNIKIVNEYGPTENSVITTCNFDVDIDCLNIGHAITNTNTYVLNKAMLEQPYGVEGELYVGGNGVARGYLNREELTKERFVEHPTTNEKLYKTGDVVKKLRNNSFEFCGRADNQVKIHGFRIELEEIENAAKNITFVEQAVSTVYTDKAENKKLVIYLISKIEIDRSEVRKILNSKLPYYMVPNYIEQVPYIPMTVNGKIDYRSLPEPTVVDSNTDNYVEPMTIMEKKLAEIWKEVLCIDKIGINENFFALGGDSILSMQIVSKAKSNGIRITPKLLLENQTIADLSLVADEEIENDIEQGLVSGDVILTPIQRWFFEQNIDDVDHFNQSVLLTTPHDININTLNNIFNNLVEHHDVLRMNYKLSESTVKQYNNERIDLEIEEVDMSCKDKGTINEIIKAKSIEAQQDLSIEDGKLIKVIYFNYGEVNKGRLLIIIHHLVIDGVSWRILVEDISKAYNYIKLGEQIKFDSKTVSFKQWSEHLSEYADSESLKSEINYWTDNKRSSIESIKIDNPLGSNTEKDIVSYSFTIDKEQTKRLVEISSKSKSQVNELLLSAFISSSNTIVNDKNLLIDMEGHGREEIEKEVDISRTVGWFTSMYPVLFNLNEYGRLGTLRHVKETLRSIPNKGMGYGVLKYLSTDSEISKKLSNQPEAQIGYNFLGTFNSEKKSKGTFEYAEESKGIQICPEISGSCISKGFDRPHLLEVESMIADGELNVSCYYSNKLYSTNTIVNLMEKYNSELESYTKIKIENPSEYLVPSDFPLATVSNDELRMITSKYVNMENIYNVSPLQEGMLLQNKYSSNDGSYTVQFKVNIEGNLDINKFKYAWNYVVSKWESLRTAYIWEDIKVPQQIVLKNSEVNIHQEDLVDLEDIEQQKHIEDYLIRDRRNGFDLSKPPIRLYIGHLRENQYTFICSVFHTVMDGWSWPLVWNEILRVYICGEKSNNDSTSNVIPYSKYIQWMQNQNVDESEVYWKNRLEDIDEPTSLPFNKVDLGMKSENKNYSNKSLVLSKEYTSNLKNWAANNKVTMNTLLLGSWSLVLNQYSNSDKIMTGCVVSGRSAELHGVESMVGMFINTIPAIVDIKKDIDVVSWLQDVQKEQTVARQYEYTPLSKINRWSNISSGVGLFNSLYVFENYPEVDKVSYNSEVNFDDYETVEQVQYPLTLVGLPGDELEIKFMYDEDLFTHRNIDNLLKQVHTAIENITSSDELLVSSLSMVPKEQLNMFDSINELATSDENSKTIHGLFETIANQKGTNIAVEKEGEVITYSELEVKSNKLANYLRNRGVSDGSSVVVCIDRSIDMITGLLAVWKAGGMYVPVDAEYPQDRIDYIVNDTNCDMILTTANNKSKFINHCTTKVYVDSEASKIEQMNWENSPTNISDNNKPAYCIYTSGSTGKPKGTCITHRSVLRIVNNSNYLRINENDVILQAATVSFDAAIFEIWGALCNAAKLVLIDKDDLLDMDKLSSTIRSKNISVMFLTTALFNLLVQTNVACLNNVRHVLVGGERVSLPHMNKALAFLGENRIIHVYGPTETTVFATYYPVSEIKENDNTVPIGLPLTNTTLHVLNESMIQVPVGVPGELYIGGTGLAVGYLNMTEMTEKHFIKHPKTGERLYKTGDIVKRNENGEIVFIGRRDNQVKVRGFRIELGEIQTKIKSISNVKDASVIVREDKPGDKKIVAYIVLNQEADSEEIRNILKDMLPEYMIPSRFMFLDELPLTKNGKVDVKALPVPEQKLAVSRVEDSELSKVEAALVEVWEDVLGVKGISVEDNYFDLGGDSILGILIVSKAKNKGLVIVPKQLFKYPTIRELSKVVNSVESKAEQGTISGDVPLTPIQKWFFENEYMNKNHFNQSMILNVSEDIDYCKLKETLESILVHHDALRMNYSRSNDVYNQFNATSCELDFNVVHLDGNCKEKIMKQVEDVVNASQAALDIKDGKLFRSIYFKTNCGYNMLFITIHHLVIDGVSWRILVEDLNTAYEQILEGNSIKLPLKTTSYKEWSEKLSKYVNSDDLQQQKAYWRSIENIEVNKLFKDNINFSNNEGDVVSYSLELSKEDTQLLLKKVPSKFKTQINDILLTSLLLTMNKEFNESKIKINLEGHGREDIIDDVDTSRTVGWFTSIYPVVLETTESGEIVETLLQIKEELSKIPNKGIGYGILKYLDSSFGNVNKNNEPQISFNYLGQFDQGKSDEVFSFSDVLAPNEVASENERAHLIDVLGRVVEGKLVISWMYSASMGVDEIISNAVETQINYLKEIINEAENTEAKHLSLNDFPLSEISEKEFTMISNLYKDIENIYTLSPLQEGMLYQNRLDNETGDYIIQFRMPIQGDLNTKSWNEAWQRAVDYYSILRTSFEWEIIEKPHQIVHASHRVNFIEYDFSDMDEKEYEDRVTNHIREESLAGFTLKEPPMKCTIIKKGESNYDFIWCIHHILVDGWSWPLIWQKVFKEYANIQNNLPLDISEELPYQDYIKWLKEQDENKAEEFFRDWLKGYYSPIQLPGMNPEKLGVQPDYKEIMITLSSSETESIRTWVKDGQLTINTLLQGSWAYLLSSYTGENDIVFGSIVSGRPVEMDGIESMVGLFINTVPVRIKLEEDIEVQRWMKGIQERQIELTQYQYSSLTKVQEWSDLRPGNKMFESLYVYENYPMVGESNESGLILGEIKGNEQTNYPLIFMGIPGEKLRLRLVYDKNRFDEDVMEPMLEQVKMVLNSICGG
ncbi:amino acid adenylation domain-containing protein [Paraclostridium sp. AKS46]|nr:amino acid adenylation domain-containing protein [Paraclostridium sp. AKS46]